MRAADPELVARLRAAAPVVASALLEQRRAFARDLAALLAREPGEEARALLPVVEDLARRLQSAPDPLAPKARGLAPDGSEILVQPRPLGVVGFLLEGRPGMLARAAALALLAGNSALLRPGRKGLAAHRLLARLFPPALRACALPQDALAVLEGEGSVEVMLEAPLDLLVVRGGEALQARAARAPRVAAGPGRNHLYVDRSADPAEAAALARDSRLAFPDRCTAVQTLLLHREVAGPVLAELVRLGGLEFLGCPSTIGRLEARGVPCGAVDDWEAERRGPVLALREVDGDAEAFAHVRQHGSGHTEGLVARDPSVQRAFLEQVDAAILLVNVSFSQVTAEGLGMEWPGLGVSTARLERGMLSPRDLTARRTILAAPGPDPDLDRLLDSSRGLVLPHHESPAALSRLPVRCFVQGRGCRVWDSRGRRYLDGLSMLWVVNAGHGQPEILAAVKAQARHLCYSTLYGGFLHPAAVELAGLLRDLAPGDLETCFFASGGAEAVEAAVKLARAFHLARGETARQQVLVFQGAYHGMTMGALSACGVPAYRQPFEPLVPWFPAVAPPFCPRCPLGLEPGSCGVACAELPARAADEAGAGTVSAMLAEPILSPMGAWVPPPEYWPRVVESLRARGILWIADEVRTGVGRAGHLFAVERWGLVPDLLVLGKGLASGYAPISAVVLRRPLAEAMAEEDCREGFTMGGHPLGAAAACANLRFMLERGLPARAQRLGEVLVSALRERLAGSSLAGGVWGTGLHLAIPYLRDRERGLPYPREAKMPYRVEEEAWGQGLYLGRTSPMYTFLAPPLVISEAEVEELVEGVAAAVARVEDALARQG